MAPLFLLGNKKKRKEANMNILEESLYDKPNRRKIILRRKKT